MKSLYVSTNTFKSLRILCAFTLCLVNTALFSQWQPTNASNATNNSFTGLIEHNGSLYCSSYEGLKKWDTSSEQWNSVNFSGFEIGAQEYIEHLTSTGDYMYVTKWNAFCATNNVYKSSDDGNTFVVDTVGLPRNSVCDTVPASILAFFSLPNGRLVAEFGATFYTKLPTDAEWVVDGTLRRYMAFSPTTWYRLNSSALFKSTDEGQTWTTSAATSFPPGLQPSVLEVNSETGRIYMNAKYGFDNISLYTDNEGTTWDTLHVNDFLGNSYIGIPQIVRGLIAKGDYIVFGADQNANGSHSDVYVSTDGGVTFATDTVGLAPNAGIENVIELRFYNDELFMALNGNEIYRKGGIANISTTENLPVVSLYPNPSNDLVHLKSDREIDFIEIVDLQGNVVMKTVLNSSTASLDLSNIVSGVYLVKIQSGNNGIIQRIVKQ